MQFKLSSVFLVYLRQMKSKLHIQGHFCKLEIKSNHLAPRLMVFFQLFVKILAPKRMQKSGEVCFGSLYISLVTLVLEECWIGGGRARGLRNLYATLYGKFTNSFITTFKDSVIFTYTCTPKFEPGIIQ